MLAYKRISPLSLIHRCFLGGLILAISLVGSTGANTTIVINELMASNDNCIQDPQGQYDDWIEIHNYGPADIDIGSMYLTDDLSVKNKWRIPDNNPALTTIPAGGYLLIWADNDINDDGLHANFKLDADGEEVGLAESDGVTTIDSVVFPDQFTDISYGRITDANEIWCFFDSPSPAAQNESGYFGDVAKPKISQNHGFYDDPFSVTITTETEDAVIYYTLDGSVPGDFYGRVRRGTRYTEPVTISYTTCLRARALKDGWKSSNVSTQTYIFIDYTIVQNQGQARSDGYPSKWSNYTADYEMDEDIYYDPNYSGQMADAMLSVPTLSIVTNKEYLFGQVQEYTCIRSRKATNGKSPYRSSYFAQMVQKNSRLTAACEFRADIHENRKNVRNTLSVFDSEIFTAPPNSNIPSSATTGLWIPSTHFIFVASLIMPGHMGPPTSGNALNIYMTRGCGFP